MKGFKVGCAVLLSSLLSFAPAFGQRHSSGPSHSRSSAARPYYGGGEHTNSHGGHYQGNVIALGQRPKIAVVSIQPVTAVHAQGFSEHGSNQKLAKQSGPGNVWH